MTGQPPDDRRGSDQGGGEISDLIGAELTLALMGWLVVTLVCFFFVGPVVGLILVFGGLIGFGWWAFSALRRADTSD